MYLAVAILILIAALALGGAEARGTTTSPLRRRVQRALPWLALAAALAALAAAVSDHL